jgi:hypothetical protein
MKFFLFLEFLRFLFGKEYDLKVISSVKNDSYYKDIFKTFCVSLNFIDNQNKTKTIENVIIDLTRSNSWFKNLSNIGTLMKEDESKIEFYHQSIPTSREYKYYNNETNNSLSFFTSNVDILFHSSINGIISLDRNNNNIYSFLNYNKIIKGEPKFSIIYNSKEVIKLNIYGEENENEDIFKKKGNYCNISNENFVKNLWNCKIQAYSKNSSQITLSGQYIVFDTNLDVIIPPSPIGSVILNEYANTINSTFGGKCLFFEDDHIKLLYCNISNSQLKDNEGIPDFSLIIENNIKLTAIIDDLFKEHSGSIQIFKIIIDKKKEDNIKLWYIGHPILKNYHLLFISKNNTIYIAENFDFGLYLVYIGFIIGFSILLIFLFMLYKARKKGNEISISLINK